MTAFLREWGWLFAVAALVGLMVWAARGLDPACPDCGRDARQAPHLPRCKYWSD